MEEIKKVFSVEELRLMLVQFFNSLDEISVSEMSEHDSARLFARWYSQFQCPRVFLTLELKNLLREFFNSESDVSPFEAIFQEELENKWETWVEEIYILPLDNRK